MTGLNDLAAKIEADRATAEALAGPINSSKGQAEHAIAAIGGLGAEGAAARMRPVVDQIEEAESIRATLQGALVKAHFQVMSAIHGRLGPGAPGSGAIVPLTRTDPQTGAPKAGLDAVPPHLRQDTTPTGEELTGVDPSLSPFQKEHEGATDDLGRNRAQRFSRKLVRNIGDISGGSKETAKVSYKSMSGGYEPPRDPQVYETVGVAEPPGSVVGPQPAPKAAVEDTVASMVVMAVVAVEGLSRLIRSRGK